MLTAVLRQERQQSQAEEDELEELENVTSDIKEWLTATFATKQQVRLWQKYFIYIYLFLILNCSQQENLWRHQASDLWLMLSERGSFLRRFTAVCLPSTSSYSLMTSSPN